MNANTRTFLFIVLLVALPVASFLALFKPMYKQMQDARAELRQKQDQVRALDEARKSPNSTAQDIAMLKEALERFRQQLPEGNEVEKVILELCELAKANGLTVKSFHSLDRVNGGSYGEDTIRWQLSGTLPGFSGFLNKLENLPRITRIKQLKLERDDKDPRTINIEFRLSIFFDNGGKAVAAAG